MKKRNKILLAAFALVSLLLLPACGNGTARLRVARLNSDGTLDPTFAPASLGTNADAMATALQSDGKVLLGGLFTSFGTSTARYLARLTYIGTLD